MKDTDQFTNDDEPVALETIYEDTEDADDLNITFNPNTNQYVPTIEGCGWGFYDTLAEAAEAVYNDPPSDEDVETRFLDWMHEQDWVALIA